MSELIIGLVGILVNLINIYIWIIIIAALLTWVNPDPHNPIVQILYRLTEPAYKLTRRYIPTVFNGIDLAPLIIVIALQVIMVVIQAVVRSLLY
ncbi:YggT family protein [Sulfurimonas sp. HSL-1716]|uniref:YggT family protein n=1 Tax=Hydrocurvibacter sulfurireducens TaxID=3131937 RepID=UPI0031F7CFC1